MGGKNAIIVDSSADLKRAAAGIANSAFSFQGQKCSACSRAVVLSDVYDVFVEEIIACAKVLKEHQAVDETIFRWVRSSTRVLLTESPDTLRRPARKA